ncbi:MAG: glycoside hydrolase family 57 protein [Woeseia sp.]
MTAPLLKLVLCWHMHQPQYRRVSDGQYRRPWTWLHGIKDYTDMAAHLESVPGARAVVNFSTILLEQISDYADRLACWQRDGQAIGDPLLDALGGRLPTSPEMRLALTEACRHANKIHMVAAFPIFAVLHEKASVAVATGEPLGVADFYDLLVWYHLAWTGESVRRAQPLVRKLQEKGREFSADDGRQLLALIGDLLGEILPRYRRLAESGSVELSVTPHAHPILPLLIDTAVALEAMPEVALPPRPYPGGMDRCRWHLDRAIAVFERHFGFRPRGCWPSEGGVSEAVLPLLAEHRFHWTATGTKVLRNSVGRSATVAHFRAWRLTAGQQSCVCFFRDDELSDRIGFRYSTWSAEHAVDDFIARLEAVRRNWTDAPAPVVSMIMDGENAWEHYPYNAWYFLQHLYSKLAQHPHIELATYDELIAGGIATETLPQLVAGSWVYGNFAVWIGDAQKNRAWDLLIEAKECVDRALASKTFSPVQREAIAEQLGVCEGSDWFWWLGSDNRLEDSIAFDSLLHEHLEALYVLLGEPLPGNLQPIVPKTSDLESPADGGGAMRRASQ